MSQSQLATDLSEIANRYAMLRQEPRVSTKLLHDAYDAVCERDRLRERVERLKPCALAEQAPTAEDWPVVVFWKSDNGQHQYASEAVLFSCHGLNWRGSNGADFAAAPTDRWLPLRVLLENQ